ncbi:hypothetical protein [Bradyrhizobium sp. CCBAU 53415]|uniref:hypothetical protein n=1 Tax=Bradyrhizobium sp. CCBAU 53415 TaxID=1325119 RepID=UPI0023054159|nr:hypothetical protein [Bradyrhizobium sp. CCBAU 53415]
MKSLVVFEEARKQGHIGAALPRGGDVCAIVVDVDVDASAPIGWRRHRQSLRAELIAYSHRAALAAHRSDCCAGERLPAMRA